MLRSIVDDDNKRGQLGPLVRVMLRSVVDYDSSVKTKAKSRKDNTLIQLTRLYRSIYENLDLSICAAHLKKNTRRRLIVISQNTDSF